MGTKSLRCVSFWILAMFLAACSGPVAPTPTPTAEEPPYSAGPSVVITEIVNPVTPQPADVLLELAWEEGFPRQEVVYTFGRVPEFSHTFANDPEALSAIRTLLQEYQHPGAQPYAPTKAALFVRPVGAPSDLPVLDWPLDLAWLARGTPDTSCVRQVAGDDLQALLAVTGRNLGDFYFRDADQVYNVYLVPWLPGVDYTDLIASSGIACPAEGRATPYSAPIFVGDELLTLVVSDTLGVYLGDQLVYHAPFPASTISPVGLGSPWSYDGHWVVELISVVLGPNGEQFNGYVIQDEFETTEIGRSRGYRRSGIPFG